MTAAAFLLLSASAAAGENDPADLSRLHDIVIPDAVSSWPPGPAWVVVAYVMVGVFLIMGIRAGRSWKANRYRRLALSELAEIERSRESNLAIGAIPALLKRTALVAYGRHVVASLSGEPWYRFLENSSQSFRDIEKPAAFFISSTYEPDTASQLAADDRGAIFRATRLWIRSHRVEGASPVEGSLP